MCAEHCHANQPREKNILLYPAWCSHQTTFYIYILPLFVGVTGSWTLRKVHLRTLRSSQCICGKRNEIFTVIFSSSEFPFNMAAGDLLDTTIFRLYKWKIWACIIVSVIKRAKER